MNEDFQIVPLSPEYQGRIEGWTAESAQQLLMKLPEISLGSRDLSWVAVRQNDPIAVCSIHATDTGTYSIYTVVKPSERRSGIASLLLAAVLAKPEVQNLSHIQAFVEVDNIAAQKLLAKSSFSQLGYDEYGRLKYEKR